MARGMLIHQISVLIVIANGMRLLRPSRVPQVRAAPAERGRPPAQIAPAA